MFNKIKNIRLPKFIKNNELKIIVGLISIITIILLVLCVTPGNNIVKTLGRNFLEGLGIYTEEIKKVEIESNDYDNPGSWRITKSAKWISTDTAELTIKLNSILKTGQNNKDIIIVLDISGSMSGDKIDKAINDAKELTDYVLSDSRNRVALITFDSTSTILSTFTNDKNEILTKLNSINVDGCTNYNAALQNVNSIMENYNKKNNCDVITLFLTDGYPNEETPNQIGTYEVLKDKYPYMTINGIQYEMGLDIIDEIKQISDNQWVANQETLNNVLFEAAITPITYENLIITDYIHNDYFTINSVEDIKTTNGTVTLTEESGVPKITWKFGDYKFLTGGNATLKAKIKLKQQYVGNEGYYPTSKNEIVNYKVVDETSKTTSSTKTPVLKNSFEVVYDTNTPIGCNLPSIQNETHYVYQNVTKNTNQLSCEGYLFKGWEIDGEDDSDITHVNDDTFVMPAHNVTIRGTWTRQTVTKTMDGTVHEKTTLYKVLKNEAKVGTYAKEYVGEHQDSMDVSKSAQKIYYYNSSNNSDSTTIKNKNNVIFANQCWQMFRTTDTGGVKLLYNGEAINNKCLDTRDNHVGYSQLSSQKLNYNYWYGNDYTYDSGTGQFTLIGPLEQITWSDSTASGLIGKYTCKTTNELSNTCSTLYLVDSYVSNTNANVFTIDASTAYSSIGKLPFNYTNTSPGDVGYMINDKFKDISYYPNRKEIGELGYEFYTNQNYLYFWYADSYEYRNGYYYLINPYKLNDISELNNINGKYTFFSTYENGQSSSISIIVKSDIGSDLSSYSTIYYMKLRLGENYNAANKEIIYGDSYIKNGDGTYTLSNTNTLELDKFNDTGEIIAGNYICEDIYSNTCNEIYYVVNSWKRYDYFSAIKVSEDIKYGNSFTYDENTNTYSLSGYTVNFWNYSDDANLELLKNAHYTCFNSSGECSEIVYIYDCTSFYTLEGFVLRNGQNIEEYLNDLLKSNDKNSLIKNSIELWYKHSLLGYDDYIEDVIYCNDRTIRSLSHFNPNGGGVFDNYINLDLSIDYYEYDFDCHNNTDKFSVSNSSAPLNYKVGLMVYSEYKIISNSNLHPLGKSFWSITPKWFSTFSDVYNNGGSISSAGLKNEVDIRPVISLRPGIEYSDGDGSMEHPYIIDTN